MGILSHYLSKIINFSENCNHSEAEIYVATM